MTNLPRLFPFLLTASLALAAPLASAQNSDPTHPGPPTTEPEDSAAPKYSKPVVFLGTQTIERQRSDVIGVSLLSFVNGMGYAIPRGWKVQAPKDPAALVQMRVPPPQGVARDDAVVNFYADLTTSVHQTIDAWLNEIDKPLWTPEISIWLSDLGAENGLNITLLTAVGTYIGPSPLGAEPLTLPDSMLLAAIIEGAPGGTLYIKAVGPKDTLEPDLGWWQRMIRSFVAAKPPQGFRDPRIPRDIRLKALPEKSADSHPKDPSTSPHSPTPTAPDKPRPDQNHR